MNLRAALKKHQWSSASLTTDTLVVHVVKRWSYCATWNASLLRRGRWQGQYEVTGIDPRSNVVLWQAECTDLNEIAQYLAKVVPANAEFLLGSEDWD